MDKVYVAIDLKSFYASVEWVSNGRLTSFSKKNFKSLFEMAALFTV